MSKLQALPSVPAPARETWEHEKVDPVRAFLDLCELRASALPLDVLRAARALRARTR